ncbi:hypothetical protein AX14_002984 [Amanita brunnescens Koide BX004]|nr:hypothetical protein AX14_002984 [Amanita brunnescens Koide BX004]
MKRGREKKLLRRVDDRSDTATTTSTSTSATATATPVPTPMTVSIIALPSPAIPQETWAFALQPLRLSFASSRSETNAFAKSRVMGLFILASVPSCAAAATTTTSATIGLANSGITCFVNAAYTVFLGDLSKTSGG